MKKYIVYQTINLVNSKIYIGVHGTDNPDVFDGYFGCGVSLTYHYYLDHPKTYFQKALKKYGFKNFRRTTLAVFDTAEEAYSLEERLVTPEFIKRTDTYNLALGGGNGSAYYRPVYQFTLTGKLIKVWDNNSAAAEALGTSQPNISQAKLDKGSCLGYYWSDSPVIDITEYHNHVGRLVYQYDFAGRFCKSYSSLTKAAIAIGDSEKVIYRAIVQGIRRQGFYWSFDLLESYIPNKISLRGKPLYVYDLQGNFIVALTSVIERNKFFQIRSLHNLKASILNGTPFKGYQVSLENLQVLPPLEDPKNKAKSVGCYNELGELIETFPSIKQATKKYGTKVIRIIRGQKSSIKGLTFKVL